MIDKAPRDTTRLAPPELLPRLGSVFATFDGRTQDSGNVSFGVEIDGRRWFVKTPGPPGPGRSALKHAERVALLHNATRLARSVIDPALPELQGTLPSAWGPMLVYEWAEGELIATPADRRDNTESSFQRFRRLPIEELLAALDTVLGVHLKLAREGWVASDFYDGSLLYDFVRRRLHLIDLDHYHAGPFVNRRGRMFGSSRFMAPEEFEHGATLDERSTVFTLGRLLSVFLCNGGLLRNHFRANDARHEVMLAACQIAPADRYPSVAAFVEAWRLADPAGTVLASARPTPAARSTSFEFRRRLDGLAYRFEPCLPRHGRAAWKRVDHDVWLAWRPGRGWCTIGLDGEVNGCPWRVEIAEQGEQPPEGDWVSKKADKSYVYDLVRVG